MLQADQLIAVLQAAAQRAADNVRPVLLSHVVDLRGIRIRGVNKTYEFAWVVPWHDIRDRRDEALAEGEKIVRERLKSTRRGMTH